MTEREDFTRPEDMPEDIKDFIESLKEPETVRIEVKESEFRGYMEEQREKHSIDYLHAQMGMLGVDAALRKVNFAQHIGKRVNFFKDEYVDPLTGEEMVRYGCEFDEKDNIGFKIHEREK